MVVDTHSQVSDWLALPPSASLDSLRYQQNLLTTVHSLPPFPFLYFWEMGQENDWMLLSRSLKRSVPGIFLFCPWPCIWIRK